MVRLGLGRLFFMFLLSALTGAETLTFGIVPQQSAQVLAANWQPVIDQLRTNSGIELSFQTAPSIPEFEQRLLQGEYDVAYMNPYHFTVFGDDPGYRALVREVDKKIVGIILVHRDSPVNSLAELDAGKIAFPAPLAFAATLVTQSNLKQAGAEFTSLYVRTHDSVYMNTARGFVDAGGGIDRTFNNMPDDIKNELRVLWRSKGYTPHAIAVHPNMDSDLASKLQQAFLTLSETPAGLEVLKNLGMKGFEPALYSDWDDVRDLNIKIE